MPTELSGVSVDWKSLFDKMSMGFSVQKLIWDASGNPVDIEYIDVNPWFEKITGITRENAVGNRTSVLIPRLERIVYEHYGKVVRTGQPEAFEQMVEELGIVFKVYAFKTGEDEFATVFEDVTLIQKERERRIKETALLTTLIDSMTDYIFYKDKAGTYILCNRAFADEYAGAKKNEVIGKTDKDLFSLKDPKKFVFILERDHEVLDLGNTIKIEWETNLADGTPVSLETIKTPLKSEKGEILGLVGVSRNITERKNVENNLSKKMSELEFLNRLMVDRELKMIELKKKVEALTNKTSNSENRSE